MKKGLMSILACPVCKGELQLGIEKEDGIEIITGSLHCPGCNFTYRIRDAIPILLPPDQQG